MLNAVILYDGFCPLCDTSIKFIFKRDFNKVLRFAHLQSNTGKSLLNKLNINHEKNDSFILILNGVLFEKSSAAFKLLTYFRWYWKSLYVLRIFPTSLLDYFYGIIAGRRYKLFGKYDKCIIPSGNIRKSFLDFNSL